MTQAAFVGTDRHGGKTFDVLIVGAGHAGVHLAAQLRQRKFTGTIALVGDEPVLPYERPPLSKDYLSGEKGFDRILLKPPAFYADRNVTLLLGRSVRSIDPDSRRVALADGGTLGYGSLIWAAGGTPRRLSCDGHDLVGVHSVRNRADVDRMMDELPSVERVCVVGGGYIGLEAAAVLRKLGRSVTVVEAQDRVLARVAGAALSRFFEQEHWAHGVDLRLDTVVDHVVGRNGRATGVRLGDGAVIDCEMVIVGIGIVPAVAPLAEAGAAIANGVLVDELCRTSLADVFAIGDCACHPNPFAGGATIRLESVQNANDQAAVVARMLTGAAEPYGAVPWFWSNQYDLKLQTVGLSTGFDDAVMRGDPADRSFSVIYLRDGAVIALDCVNAVKDYVQGRALVQHRAVVAPAILADRGVRLADMIAHAPSNPSS